MSVYFPFGVDKIWCVEERERGSVGSSNDNKQRTSLVPGIERRTRSEPNSGTVMLTPLDRWSHAPAATSAPTAESLSLKVVVPSSAISVVCHGGVAPKRHGPGGHGGGAAGRPSSRTASKPRHVLFVVRRLLRGPVLYAASGDVPAASDVHALWLRYGLFGLFLY